ncbi:MAG: Lrp/AsnC family transcriptional regulator [Candidatus Methanomethylicota archaeon]|uniref:Lrp/AsnC family transcriptional regulator n=1 Tax=Thermoproteota archaeon TaxID=2056631 RepID=A0A497ESG3_9CREN|nr:MAG: Lrp/AsnC family transcriptional regulator [Candidatus Verstraetearchaeota archaeon]
MPIRAFVLVKTKPGTSEEVVRARRIRGVKIANSVFGRYDAILVIEAKDLGELKGIIYEVLEKLPNVEHTETHVAIFHPPE